MRKSKDAPYGHDERSCIVMILKKGNTNGT